MHHNYYFLRQFVAELGDQLKGSTVDACFSQNKDELIIGFTLVNGNEYHLKADLKRQMGCLFLAQQFNRAKKNSIDLFPEVIGQQVISLRQFTNERCFGIQLGNNYQLLFKLFGNHTNILLFKEGQWIGIFKKGETKDQELDINQLDREITQTFAAFEQSGYQAKTLFPTFGPVVWAYLDKQNFREKSPEAQWELLEATHQHLLNPEAYYLTLINEKPHLSLLKLGDVLETFKSPIEGLNSFYLYYHSTYLVEKAKKEMLSHLDKKWYKAQSYIDQAQKKLDQDKVGAGKREIADIIMANMHQIPNGATEVELFNFYTNAPIKIKLKRDLSPQKNAERLYKKAKNENVAIEKLQENIQNKEKELERLEAEREQIAQAKSIKQLRQLQPATQKTQEVNLPYHVLFIDGYQTLIGRNGAANDKLTLHHASKDDIWLHAKDVPGSHVVIKAIPGQKVPPYVIEKAAECAAYFSKRKHDSLCPVIYTPKKHVYKRKGDKPGEVHLRQEEVIMVPPVNPFQE